MEQRRFLNIIVTTFCLLNKITVSKLELKITPWNKIVNQEI